MNTKDNRSVAAESSTPVIRKASGLTSLIQSNQRWRLLSDKDVLVSGFSGSDSDDEEKHLQSIINTTVISKTPNLAAAKQANGKAPIE